MSAAQTWRDTVRPIAEGVMRDDTVPGMVIAVAQGNGAPEFLAVGTDAVGTPLDADTLFPVASITKLATALAVLRLVAAGELALDAPLALYLPEAAAAREGVTLRAMLSHVAGLPDDVSPEFAPYTKKLDWPTLAHACLLTPPITAPRTRVRYSNLGSGLLAIAVERRTGSSFGTALRNLVLEPLGIEGYLGVEPPRPPARVTDELGDHRGDDLEPYNSAFWRTLALPWGGLITTAAGALSLARAFAGRPAGYLPETVLAEATRDQTDGLAGGFVGLAEWSLCPWGLGVELRGAKTPHFAPIEAAPTSYGHTGASGCLAWVDPVADVSWALLGARTIEHWALRKMPMIGATILAAAHSA